MMRIELKVEYADGSGVETTATAPDLIAFERHYDKSMAVFGTDTRIEYILWLTWHALNRKKETALEFDPWVETVDSVTAGDSGE